MRSLFFVTSLFALLAGSGCASAPPAPSAPPTPAMHSMKGMGNGAGMHGAMHANGNGDCPMALANTTVTAEDVDGGAALVFTSTGDVADLRARVSKLAEHHNAKHGAGGAGEGMMKNVPASLARVEEVDGGARMILTPKAPGDIDALRSHVRAHATSAQAGGCPMHGAHSRR